MGIGWGRGIRSSVSGSRRREFLLSHSTHTILSLSGKPILLRPHPSFSSADFGVRGVGVSQKGPGPLVTAFALLVRDSQSRESLRRSHSLPNPNQPTMSLTTGRILLSIARATHYSARDALARPASYSDHPD